MIVAAATSNSNRRAWRRRSPKRGSGLRVYGNTMGLGANLGAAILDVSETGARLILTKELPKGKEFEVGLEGPGSRWIKRAAHIVWSAATQDGRFVVGVRFTAHLTYSDVQDLAKI
jgi:hypothetical protein